ncbi:MAG: hypothetical protein ACYC6G_11250 [Desulfobaccales bacterium]
MILFILSIIIPASANAHEIRTKKTCIKFNDMDSLYRMYSKLSFEPEKDFLQGYSLNSNLANQPLCPPLCTNVDGLLFKVCKILPKCPGRQPLLTIELIEDARKVRQQLSIISPFQTTPSDDSLEGFFASGYNVIYISIDGFRVGILGHEMTHYLLCQFSPIPDMDLQEKWARYVDTIVDPNNYY